jgi:hypothetical protein
MGGFFAISLSSLFEIVLVGLFTKNTQRGAREGVGNVDWRCQYC